MSETTIIVVLCVALLQSLIVCIGNSFTIFVFWIHRNKLKRTSFLLMNLTFADLLVGVTDILVVGTFILPQNTGHYVFDANKTRRYKNISLTFQTAFSAVSVFFLVLIAVERAFALIWPLRHRVTSFKSYIYSVVIVWLAGITVISMNVIILYDFLNRRNFFVVFCFIIVASLVTICVSYLAIRKRLNDRGPGIDTAHYRQNKKKIANFSKTIFFVIGASLVFWVPGLVLYFVCYWYPARFSKALLHIFAMLFATNSLVNPIIYSFRMQIFRETLKRLKSKLKCRRRLK